MSGSRDVSLTIFITSISGIKSFTSSLTGSSTSAYIFISKFFDTKAPSVSAGELVLLRHAASSLIFSTMDRAFCQTLTSLGLAESGIPHAVPATLRPRTPLISFCTVHPRILCTRCFLETFSLRPLVHALESCPVSVAPWSSTMPHPPPPPGRGRATITTTMHMSSCSVCKS